MSKKTAEYPTPLLEAIQALDTHCILLDQRHGPGGWEASGVSRHHEALVRNFVGAFRPVLDELT